MQTGLSTVTEADQWLPGAGVGVGGGGDQSKRDSEEGMEQGEQGMSKVRGVMVSWVEAHVQLTESYASTYTI